MKPPSLLSQLTSVPLATPCESPWDAMQGDDKLRHCTECSRDVYDLSAMAPIEAELRLLNAPAEVPCIRYLRAPDGSILHRLAPRSFLPSSPARSLTVASALGLALTPSAAFAGGKRDKRATADDACVVFTQPADNSVVASAKPSAAQEQSGVAGLSPSKGRAAKEPTMPPSESPPVRLAGKAMAPRERAPYGTLTLKSSLERKVRIAGIELTAPLPSYNLTPGNFTVEILDGKKKPRMIAFKITADHATLVDLDKR